MDELHFLYYFSRIWLSWFCCYSYPLISPNSSKGGVGIQAIAEALELAGLKVVITISVIIAGGRLQIAENQNAEIFSANTLLVILGTSLLTARAGLSMALGAFLAGLLLAEPEFSLQVESDIAPYRGLLLRKGAPAADSMFDSVNVILYEIL